MSMPCTCSKSDPVPSLPVAGNDARFPVGRIY